MASQKKKRSQPKANTPARGFPVIRPNVAGLDVGSTEHCVCGPVRPGGAPNIRVFRTTTPQLEELAEWLLDQEVESIAMESTHVYWIPIYELLESRGIEVVLVNTRQFSHVPGRKTDVQDCQWLQQLHSCGLLRGSFRPEESICRLRALHRQLANFVEERTKCVQWMQKALDQMNVQVHRAVTDITGNTGMAIIRAIVAGDRDPRHLATFRDRRCKKTEEEIAEHLTGNWRTEHLLNLESSLHLYDFLQESIRKYEELLLQEIDSLPPGTDEPAPPHPNLSKAKAIKKRGEEAERHSLWRTFGIDLTRIDGISPPTAKTILTEVGLDFGAFPSEKHFASWLRLTPRRPISGGKLLKKKSKGTGANRVAAALRMAALSVRRTKTALGAYYRRVSTKKGAGVAVFATARKIAKLVYRMIRFGQDYVDIGQEAYEARYTERHLAALRSTAKTMGYTLEPCATTA